jgi:hypothetical protein
LAHAVTRADGLVAYTACVPRPARSVTVATSATRA